MKSLQRYFSTACFLAFCLLILSLPAFAQGTISVKCLDQAGNPVAGVKVVAVHFQTGKAKDKKSDAKGIAEFAKMDDGVYRVVGRKDGFAPALYEFVGLKSGAAESVTLQFKPGDPASKLYFEDQAIPAKAGEAFEAAVKALRENKYPDAITHFKEALDLIPSIAEAHFYMALAYLQEKNFDLAEESLKKASAIAANKMLIPARDPSAPNPNAEIKAKADDQLTKIPAYRLKDEGEKAFAAKKYDEALAKFDQALKIDPNNVDLLMNYAVTAANTKKWDEAFKAMDKAIQQAPQEKALKETREKIANMQLADQMNQANALLGQGDNLFKSQDFAGALQKYQQALPNVPANKQQIVYAAIARAYAGLNDPDKTVESYKKAMELAPDTPDYRNALAQYYLKQKKYEEALNLYAEAKGPGGQAADKMLFDLGKKQSDQGNNDVAALAFDKVIKTNPAYAEAYYELGMLIYFDKTNDARASELLTKYVELGKNEDHVNNTKNVLGVLKKRMSAKK